MKKVEEKEEVGKISAKIKDVKLYTDNPYFQGFDRVYKTSELWTKKPKGLGICDSDVIVVTARTKDGRGITKVFYGFLKYDQTLQRSAIRKRSLARREEFTRFLKAYITDDVARYKVVENLGEWIGKDVKLLGEYGRLSIIIPDISGMA